MLDNIIKESEDKRLKTGDRIKELRKSKNITQVVLANILKVTDKAVSKWESNLGEPSIEMLLALAKYFDVSIDYILTGEDRVEIINMSEFERVAYEDDPEQINKLQYSFDSADDRGFTFAEYIYKHQAKKVFLFMTKSQYYSYLFNNYHNKDLFTDFVKMALICKNYDLLTKNVKRPFYTIDQINIADRPKKSRMKNEISQEIFDFVLHFDKLDEDVWNFFLPNENHFHWSNGLSVLLEKAVKEQHPKLTLIIDKIEKMNNEVDELVRNPEKLGKLINREGMIYDNPQFPYKSTRFYIKTNVSKQTVLNALENRDFELAKRLNALSDEPLSDHYIRDYIVDKDDRMSEREKNIAKVFIDGLLDIKRLVSYDDYDLYKEYIEYPVSEHELMTSLLKEKNYKELFNLALKYECTRTLSAVKNNRLDILENAIDKDFSNKKYILNKEFLNKSDKDFKSVGKHHVFFKSIIDHKDLRFFEHAAKTDKGNLDWALKEIIINRPNEFRIQKILLDSGAKLHIDKIGYDYDGEKININKIDEVGTQLLKNQINIMISKEKKSEQ